MRGTAGRQRQSARARMGVGGRGRAGGVAQRPRAGRRQALPQAGRALQSQKMRTAQVELGPRGGWHRAGWTGQGCGARCRRVSGERHRWCGQLAVARGVGVGGVDPPEARRRGAGGALRAHAPRARVVRRRGGADRGGVPEGGKRGTRPSSGGAAWGWCTSAAPSGMESRAPFPLRPARRVRAGKSGLEDLSEALVSLEGSRG